MFSNTGLVSLAAAGTISHVCRAFFVLIQTTVATAIDESNA